MKVRSIWAALSAAAVLALPMGSANAAFVSADFRTELDLPDGGFSSGPRVFESIGKAVAGAPDLSAADQIANPSGWGGSATTDLDATGLLTLTGDQEGVGFADYDLAVFTISNIVFSAGEIITGVSILVEGILDAGFGAVFSPAISFTAESVTITYDTTGGGGNSDFQFLDGGISTFQIHSDDGDTPAIPVPAALPLMLGAMGVLGFVARRRQA